MCRDSDVTHWSARQDTTHSNVLRDSLMCQTRHDTFKCVPCLIDVSDKTWHIQMCAVTHWSVRQDMTHRSSRRIHVCEKVWSKIRDSFVSYQIQKKALRCEWHLHKSWVMSHIWMSHTHSTGCMFDFYLTKSKKRLYGVNGVSQQHCVVPSVHHWPCFDVCVCVYVSVCVNVCVCVRVCVRARVCIFKQHRAAPCNTVQHRATHYNILQHTATYWQ